MSLKGLLWPSVSRTQDSRIGSRLVGFLPFRGVSVRQLSSKPRASQLVVGIRTCHPCVASGLTHNSAPSKKRVEHAQGQLLFEVTPIATNARHGWFTSFQCKSTLESPSKFCNSPRLQQLNSSPSKCPNARVECRFSLHAESWTRIPEPLTLRYAIGFGFPNPGPIFNRTPKLVEIVQLM